MVAADITDNGLITAIDPNLERFFARGGKLIQSTMDDQQISPHNSINWSKTVTDRLGGPSAVSRSYRLFMAPGMMHCGGGEGPNQFNPMAALERWRESNVAPDAIIASHVSGGVVDSTRPLSVPPGATYKGTGSPGDTPDYVCAVP